MLGAAGPVDRFCQQAVYRSILIEALSGRQVGILGDGLARGPDEIAVQQGLFDIRKFSRSSRRWAVTNARRLVLGGA